MVSKPYIQPLTFLPFEICQKINENDAKNKFEIELKIDGLNACLYVS